MIYDEQRLSELLDEISLWTLQQRREYIASIEAAFGKEDADQIRDGLTQRWARNK